MIRLGNSMRKPLRHLAFAAFAVVVFAGCKSRQNTTDVAETPVTRPVPEWVQQRPASSLYYIGIGQCPKSRADFQSTAKQNALNDLASEISVTVQGNSLLYTLDRTGAFNEEFLNTVRTRTDEKIAGYEAVDSYDGPQDYWTYYRLDKEAYAKLVADRTQKAIALAVDLHGRAQTSLAQGDLRTAFNTELRALDAIKERWGENDMVELNGTTTSLANALFSSLQNMASGVRFSAQPDPLTLNLANGFQRELAIAATYTNGGQAMAQLPIIVSFPKHSGEAEMNKATDAQGHASALVNGIDLSAKPMEVIVRLDLEALKGEGFDAVMMKPVLASLTLPEKRVPITVVLPKVFVTGTERNMARPVADGPCTAALKEELANAGFRATDRKADAELLLEITANAAPAGESNGFHTATLDLSLVARDRNGEVLYQGGRQGLKGIQLNDEKAGNDAFKKATAAVHTELFPAFLNAVIQQ
jgi:hypothetical protein